MWCCCGLRFAGLGDFGMRFCVFLGVIFWCDVLGGFGVWCGWVLILVVLWCKVCGWFGWLFWFG